MDEQIRKQMTFYRSFADAINELPKGKQLAMYRAVVSYGLTGQHCEKLDGIQATMFKLIMPNLDASRTKASAGKHGGSAPKAKGKQNESKTEEEINREKDKECKKFDFEKFWDAYPKKVGKEKARNAFADVETPVHALLSAISDQKRSAQWQKNGGEFVPNAATWLREKRWEDILPIAGNEIPMGSGELGRAELEAIQKLMGEE